MGWVESLHGATVGLDSAPFIYLIERRPEYIDQLRPFFSAASNGKFRIVTSTITLLEVLIHPLRRGDEALAHKYNDILLSSPNVVTVPITIIAAQKAAELRASYHLKTPDALQLAVAMTEGATTFLTNDRGIPAIPAINIVRLADLI